MRSMLCCLQLLTVAMHAMLFTMLTVTVHAVLFTMLAVVVYAMLFTTMLTAPHPLPNLPTASTGLDPLATAPVSCNPVHGPGAYSTQQYRLSERGVNWVWCGTGWWTG